jgi:hypothetical protein
MKYAIRLQAEDTGYECYWKQTQHLEFTSYFAYLDDLLNNALFGIFTIAQYYGIISTQETPPLIDMISLLKPHLTFEVPISFCVVAPWWTQMYQDTVGGRIDIILGGNIIIELKCCRYEATNHYLQAMLYESILKLSGSFPHRGTVLLNASLNKIDICQLHLEHFERTTIPPEFEFLWKMTRRKLRLDTLDQVDLHQCYQQCAIR